MLYVPTVGLESSSGVIAESESGVAFDGDVIVVIETDQLAEPGVSRERSGLVRDALHHVSIAGDEIHVMVDDLLLAIEHRAHVRFGYGHADCIAHSLAERASGGLNAGGIAVFWMSGRLALPLTELLQIIESEIVAREIEHAVQQHRRMSCRQHEPIAVQPIGVGGIVA